MIRLKDKWNPYYTFTCSRQEIEEWIKYNGKKALYDGRFWKIKTEKIFGNMYEVKFEAIS